MAFEVEAEGGELVLRNNYGDYAIVPRKDVEKVRKMIKDGCHNCIDNYVMNLPTAKNYAEGGTKISERTREMYDMIHGDGSFEAALSSGVISEREASSNRFDRNLWKQLNEKLESVSTVVNSDDDEIKSAAKDAPEVEDVVINEAPEVTPKTNRELSEDRVQSVRQRMKDNAITMEAFERAEGETKSNMQERINAIIAEYDAENPDNPFRGSIVLPERTESDVNFGDGSETRDVRTGEVRNIYNAQSAAAKKSESTTKGANKASEVKTAAPKEANTEVKGEVSFVEYKPEKGNKFNIPTSNEYRLNEEEGIVQKKIDNEWIQLNNQDAIRKVLGAYNLSNTKPSVKSNKYYSNFESKLVDGFEISQLELNEVLGESVNKSKDYNKDINNQQVFTYKNPITGKTEYLIQDYNGTETTYRRPKQGELDKFKTNLSNTK